MAKQDAKNNEKEMNVVGHLSELRNRLIVIAVFFIAFFITGFIFVEDIYYFFIKDLDFQLAILSPGEAVWLYFMLAGLVAFTATLPLLAYQIWAFIKPGLTPKERKASIPYIPAIFLLFVSGFVFGYFMFVELILPFLLSISEGMFNEMFTTERYFKFVLRVTLPFAILFEIPVISMFLTSLGILTPDFMRRKRKYAYFVLIVISAMITPPDFILPLIISVPLIILYEASIYLSKLVARKKEEKHREFMEG